MEKIIQNLNQILNKWLSENGFKCSVKCEDSFDYDYLNQIISYTLFDEEDQDTLFLEICKSIYPDIMDYDDFTISFFHELGHYATQNNVSKEDLENNQKFYLIDEPTENDKLEYFVSYPEWEATSWACNYLKDNSTQVKDLLNKIEQSRIDFFDYIKNEDFEE